MSGMKTTDATPQVLMVGMGDEIFAVEAVRVREILDPVPATRVVGAKAHLPAVINVRGAVIPLADLRIRFALAPRTATLDSRIVVVEVTIDDEPVVVGLMADKVYEVANLPRDDLQPTPKVGLCWPPEFIRGFATWNNNVIVVPDLDRILA